jgi:hypothetical protein
MLRNSEHRLLLLEVPNNDIGVFAALTGSEEFSPVRDCEAGNLVVVSSEEVLVVGIL